MYWNSGANIKASTWIRLEMIMNKYNSNFIITPWKYPLKFPISVSLRPMPTGINPRYEQPSYMNPLQLCC